MHIIFVIVLNVDRFQFDCKNYTISYAYIKAVARGVATGACASPFSEQKNQLFPL